MSKPVKKQNIRYIKAKRDAERAKRADRTERADRAGRRRSYFLVLGSLLMAALLISRLYTLQIVNSERYLSDLLSSTEPAAAFWTKTAMSWQILSPPTISP